MSTYATKLAAVQTAIETILTSGQEVRIGDKTWKAADLGQLMKLEDYYTAKAAREGTTQGARVRYAIPE